MPTKTFPDLPFWEFETAEVANNQYKVVGRRVTGNLVERNGESPGQLLESARGDAMEIERLLKQRLS